MKRSLAMFLLVEFTDNAELAVIPDNWLDGTRCAVWPPFKSPSRLIKAVYSREPPLASWKSYPIRVLYKHGKQLYISFSYERSKHIFYRKAVHWVSAEFDKCPVCLHSWEIVGNLVGTWSDLIISHVRVDQMSCICVPHLSWGKKKNVRVRFPDQPTDFQRCLPKRFYCHFQKLKLKIFILEKSYKNLGSYSQFIIQTISIVLHVT